MKNEDKLKFEEAIITLQCAQQELLEARQNIIKMDKADLQCAIIRIESLVNMSLKNLPNLNNL